MLIKNSNNSLRAVEISWHLNIPIADFEKDLLKRLFGVWGA